MKKCIMVTIALFSVLSIGWSDLGVFWKNGIIKLESDQNALLNGAKIQLIWSANGITTQSNNMYAVDNGARLAGEYLLKEGVTQTVGVADYGLWDPIEDVYNNADVGGANINNGYFFTRVFTWDGSVGEYFLDTGQVDASGYVYDSQDPSTVYNGNAIPGVALSTLDLISGGTTIPEPATFSLIAIAGLSAFFMRRRWLRSLNKV